MADKATGEKGVSALERKLDFWVGNQKNVLFVGKHGVGKTAMVKSTFDRHKMNYRYFSASTMDPWVDFVGVPTKTTENALSAQFDIIKELSAMSQTIAVEWVQSNWKMTEKSAVAIVEKVMTRKEGMTYLELVRPASFATNEVEALFFDEFNRSPKKVRNAVMELMQFKSINGHKFPNLKMVWAAINPDDDEEETYDVEKLDPAQQDRFHVTVEVPYEPNTDWFRQEYGASIADAAIEWWKELPADAKNLVSPRRLQYALDFYRERGDIRDVLPVHSNVSKLTTALNTGPMQQRLTELMKRPDDEKRVWLQNENNFASAMKYIVKSATLQDHFMPLMPKEKLIVEMTKDEKILKYVVQGTQKHTAFAEICSDVLLANTNAKMVKTIRNLSTQDEAISSAIHAASDRNKRK